MSSLFSPSFNMFELSCIVDSVDTLVKDQPSMTISIWRRLVALSPRVLRISKSPNFVSYFFAVFQSFFERNVATQEFLTLPVISEAFSILPVVLSYGGPKTEEVRKRNSFCDRLALSLMILTSCSSHLFLFFTAVREGVCSRIDDGYAQHLC